MRSKTAEKHLQQTIVLGVVLALMQAAMALLLLGRVDRALETAEKALAAVEGADLTSAGLATIPAGSAPMAFGDPGGGGWRSLGPDDEPPSLDDSAFTDELEAWLRSVADEVGVNGEGLQSPLIIYRDMEREGLLLPTSVLKERIATLAPDRLDEVSGDYLRGTLLLHVLSLTHARIGGDGPTGGDSANALAGPTAPPGGDVTTLDALLAERLARRAEEQGIEVETLLPADELREAARTSASLDSEPTRTLLQAYAAAFDQLTP
jgi:hypothetical protein